MRVVHRGYISSEAKLRKKAEILKLLELALTNHPDKLIYHYYLGRELMELGKHEEAVDELKLAGPLGPPHQAHLLLGLCECLGPAGRIDEAVEYGELAATRFPDYRDIC